MGKDNLFRAESDRAQTQELNQIHGREQREAGDVGVNVVPAHINELTGSLVNALLAYITCEGSHARHLARAPSATVNNSNMPVVQQAGNILEHRTTQTGLGIHMGQRKRIVHRPLIGGHFSPRMKR